MEGQQQLTASTLLKLSAKQNKNNNIIKTNKHKTCSYDQINQ